MKKIILIDAAVMLTAATVLVASNSCCPICKEGACPIGQCCNK